MHQRKPYYLRKKDKKAEVNTIPFTKTVFEILIAES